MTANRKRTSTTCCYLLSLVVLAPSLITAAARANSSTGDDGLLSEEGSPDTNIEGSTLPNSNCTKNSADRNDLPCTPDGCFLRDIPVTADNEEPCLTGYHQVITANAYTQYHLGGRAVPRLPVDQWVLFKSAEGQCLDMVRYNASARYCVMPGYCSSHFPWYLKIDGKMPEAFGEEKHMSMCMTDSTSRETAVCCQHAVNVTVRSCGFYNVYRLNEHIVSSLTGGICAASQKDVEDGYTKSTNVLREGQPLYKRVDKLRPEARRNLVSTRFKVLSFIRLNIADVLEKYNSDLTETLNKYFKRRAKRWGQRPVPMLSQSNVRGIVGSPYVSNNMLYHTYYIETDSGDVLAQDVIITASKYLSNTKFTHMYVYINSTTAGLHDAVSYPRMQVPSSSIPSHYIDNESQPSSDSGWMVIIYIINFTCAVIVAVFIALALYRWKLRRALKQDSTKALSRLDKMLLCEKHSTDIDIEVSVKSDPPLIPNGLSSEFIRISNSNIRLDVTDNIDSVD